jgi:hypothetical protein
MKKETLLRFINKYNLGDSIKMVNWKVISAEKVLRTRGELDTKSFIADVILKDFTEITEDVRIPIADTQKVRAMLSPFGEDVVITLNKDGDRVKGFLISDNDCESYCSAAEPSAIPPVLKNLDDKHIWEVEIKLTEEFIEKFLKAKAALNEVDEFTIKMNKDNNLEIVLGYAVANTNRISLLAPAVAGKDTFDGPAVRFPSKNFVEILKANKEILDGTAYFNPKGGLKIIFDTPQFSCLYYQFASLKK